MFTMIATYHAVSDDDASKYEVRLDKRYTVREFAEAVMSGYPSSFGSICIELPPRVKKAYGRSGFNYRFGKLYGERLSDLPKALLSLPVVSAAARGNDGGWTDYELEPDLSGTFPPTMIFHPSRESVLDALDQAAAALNISRDDLVNIAGTEFEAGAANNICAETKRKIRQCIKDEGFGGCASIRKAVTDIFFEDYYPGQDDDSIQFVLDQVIDNAREFWDTDFGPDPAAAAKDPFRQMLDDARARGDKFSWLSPGMIDHLVKLERSRK